MFVKIENQIFVISVIANCNLEHQLSIWNDVLSPVTGKTSQAEMEETVYSEIGI